MLKYLLCLSVVSSVTIAEVIEYHAHPQYSFEYGVNDPSTQDVKKQWETRDGDKVQGSYSFKEADGTVRVVEYHANDRTGFNAVVRREGHAVHPPTHNHVYEPVQTFVHTTLHAPIGSVVHIPPRTHTIVHTSVNNHNPMETILHTPVHTDIQTPIHSIHNPVHTYVSSVNTRNPPETIIHTPVHTTAQEPIHTHLRPSVSSQNPIETVVHSPVHNTVQHPVHTVLRTSVRSPVHIPVERPLYTYSQTTRHSSKTPVYTVVHNTRKTSVHTPLETTVHVPINHVSVHPEVSTRRTPVSHRKEPEAYSSQIAGAHSASLISAIP